MRLSELVGLRVSDLEIDVAIVLGRRPRACPFQLKAGAALDRYLCVRNGHAAAAGERLCSD